jgi:hypothetical protein
VDKGELTLKSGMRYLLLVVPDEFNQLSVPLVRKLSDLVKAGATVLAPRVTGSPSLADDNLSAELKKLSLDLWGSDISSQGSNQFGKGKIYWGTSVETILAAQHVTSDFTYEPPTDVAPYDYPSPKTSAEIVWNHRRTSDKDIYFVANQRMRTENVTVHFRARRKSVEIWHPDSGAIESTAYSDDGKNTTLTLHLAPEESVFVVFGSEVIKGQPTTKQTADELLTVTNPWKIEFPPNLGAPPQIEMHSLTSWTTSADPGVRYFSGTATYVNQFNLPEGWDRSGSTIVLDLGRVREFAQVTLNGKPLLDILWKPPFKLEVTKALKPGLNTIEIKVTNLWPNRIIGDQQPDSKEKYTFTVYGAYKKVEQQKDF